MAQMMKTFREKYAFATGYVHANKLIKYSKVRRPEQHSIQKVAGWIRRDGWSIHSSLYVREMTAEEAAKAPDNVTPPPHTIESTVTDFRSMSTDDFLTQCPEGLRLKPHPKFAYLTEVLDEGYEGRWYSIIDGAHRALAAVVVANEWRAEGREIDADNLLMIPVIMMSHTMPEHTMVQFASMINHSNENFIMTSNLHQMTALKRSHQLWVKHVVQPKITEIRLAEDKAETPEKDRMGVKEEAGMSSDVAWVAYADSEAKTCNQTLAQVYGRGRRTLIYWIGTARHLSELVLEHLHTLSEKNVSANIPSSYNR